MCPNMPQMKEAMEKGNQGGPTQTSPSKGSKGPTKWANENKTRGQAATGRKLKNRFESTYSSYTKLPNLKRGK